MKTVHPLVVRITHWINVIAVVIMLLSGWRIYNAAPLFPFKFPGEITLGGWLAGALQWHLAAMWLLALNGLLYLAYGLLSGHFRRKLLPVSPRAVLADVREALAHAIYLEKEAAQFYRQMSEACAGAPMAGLFTTLYNDESRHLRALEDLFEEHFLTEN